MVTFLSFVESNTGQHCDDDDGQDLDERDENTTTASSLQASGALPENIAVGPVLIFLAEQITVYKSGSDFFSSLEYHSESSACFLMNAALKICYLRHVRKCYLSACSYVDYSGQPLSCSNPHFLAFHDIHTFKLTNHHFGKSSPRFTTSHH